MEGALNWEIEETAPFTGPYFNEEIQGMADATGFPVRIDGWMEKSQWMSCPPAHPLHVDRPFASSKST